MTLEEREALLEWAKAYWGCMVSSHTTTSKIGKLTEIAIAALEYGCTMHTLDSNCNAGDCDSCSAPEALKKLETLVHGPLWRLRGERTRGDEPL